MLLAISMRSQNNDSSRHGKGIRLINLVFVIQVDMSVLCCGVQKSPDAFVGSGSTVISVIGK